MYLSFTKEKPKCINYLNFFLKKVITKNACVKFPQEGGDEMLN